MWSSAMRRSDAAAIRAVTAAAFVNAPHSGHKEHFIVDALRRAGALTVSLVAEQRRDIVGHAAASPVLIPDGSPGGMDSAPFPLRLSCMARALVRASCGRCCGSCRSWSGGMCRVW